VWVGAADGPATAGPLARYGNRGASAVQTAERVIAEERATAQKIAAAFDEAVTAALVEGAA
jgi:hypothetical protein